METPEQNIVANLPLTESAVQQQEVSPESGVSATPGESVFETKNISIYYGCFRAVTEVSLRIHE